MSRYNIRLKAQVTFPFFTSASPPTVQSITLSNQSLLLPGGKKQLNVTFSCKVTGTGPINVTWNFSGEFSRLNLILKSEVVTAAQSGNYWSNLVVSDVSGVNNGVYSCMASSKHGKDSKGKNLMIKGKSSLCITKVCPHHYVLLLARASGFFAI